MSNDRAIYGLKNFAEQHAAVKNDFKNFGELLSILSKDDLKTLNLEIKQVSDTMIEVSYCHLILTFSIEWNKSIKKYELHLNNEDVNLALWVLNIISGDGTAAENSETEEVSFLFCGHNRTHDLGKDACYNALYRQSFIKDFTFGLTKAINFSAKEA